jgi:hypothetical protein
MYSSRSLYIFRYVFSAMNITNTGFKILQHRFEIENSDGSKETKTSTLYEYGAPTGSGGYSAMAKLVGIPCGIGKSSSYIIFVLKFQYYYSFK